MCFSYIHILVLGMLPVSYVYPVRFATTSLYLFRTPCPLTSDATIELHPWAQLIYHPIVWSA